MRILLVLSLAICSLLVGSAQAQAGSAVVLLAAHSESGTVTTFGSSAATGGPLARVVQGPIQRAGFSIVPASELAAPAGASGTDGLPLGDAAAIAMAQSAGASLAVVVGVVSRSEGRLRATSHVGHRAKVAIRLLDVATGRAVFSSTADSAAYGASDALARSLASSKALARAVRGMQAKLFLRAPNSEEGQGRLSLQITGADGWRSIASILRTLAATRGVSEVNALEIRPNRVVLSIASKQGAAHVVESLRRARIHNGSVSVQLSGSSLAVRVIMNSPSTVPPVRNG